MPLGKASPIPMITTRNIRLLICCRANPKESKRSDGADFLPMIPEFIREDENLFITQLSRGLMDGLGTAQTVFFITCVATVRNDDLFTAAPLRPTRRVGY